MVQNCFWNRTYILNSYFMKYLLKLEPFTVFLLIDIIKSVKIFVWQFMFFKDPLPTGLWAPLIILKDLNLCVFCPLLGNILSFNLKKVAVLLLLYQKIQMVGWNFKTVILWSLKDNKGWRSWKYAELSCTACLMDKSKQTGSNWIDEQPGLQLCNFKVLFINCQLKMKLQTGQA
jgi:hypothetical protein